jgi:hypothetical protein
VGAYSESRASASSRGRGRLIQARDGFEATETIGSTDGREGRPDRLRLLIANDRDRGDDPIPQYPLYSATLSLTAAARVG